MIDISRTPFGAWRGSATAYTRSRGVLMTCAALALMSTPSGFAQTVEDAARLPSVFDEAPQAIRFENMTVGDGLAQGTVYQIYQDRLGFMWFATQSGLHVFDGYEVKVYTRIPFDSTSISSAWALTLHEASDGTIFVGTEGGGLSALDRATDNFTRYRHDPSDSMSILSGKVLAVAEDSAGHIWAATSRGISKLDRRSGQFTQHFVHNDQGSDSASIPEGMIFSIVVDDAGTIWAGTLDYLVEIDPASGAIRNHRTTVDPDRPDEIQHIREFDQNPGILWVGTNSGFLRFDKQTKQFERIEPDASVVDLPLEMEDIAQDPLNDHVLWVATGGEGLARYDKGTGAFQFFRKDPADPHSLVDDNIWNLTVDRAGGVWVGTPYGLGRFNPASLPFHNLDATRGALGLAHPTVPWSLMADSSGALWIVSQDAGDRTFVTRIDTRTGGKRVWQSDPDEPFAPGRGWMGPPSEDADGNIWIGSQGALARYDSRRGSWRRWELPQIEMIFSVTSVRDSDNFWLVGRGGLFEFDLATGRTRKVHLAEDTLQTVQVGPESRAKYGLDGNLWVGARDGVIRMADDGTITHYMHDPQDTTTIASSFVVGLAQRQAEPGVVWVATDSGIDRLDVTSGKVTEHLSPSTGMPDPTVYGILADADGGLWYSTNNGIGYYNPDTDEYRNYGLESGLRQLEHMPASAQGPDGTLYFGHTKGITIFHPDRLRHNPLPPEVAFTDFRVHNQSVVPAQGSPLAEPLNQAQTIQLKASQNDFAFDFVGLHFGNPTKNEYAYRLDGWDEDWRHVGHLRTASYTSLPAGKYTFRVKAANADGVWNEVGRSIGLVIHPPWWRTWWAYLSLVLLAAAMVFAIDRLQRRRLLLKERERMRIREAELLADAESQRREDAERMSEIGRAITSTLSVEGVIDKVYESVNELMDAAVFGVGVYTKDPPRIYFPASKEEGVTLPPFYHDATDMNRLSSWCLAHREDVIIGDYGKEYTAYVNELLPPVHGEAPASVLYLPLIHQDKAVGVITAQSFAKTAYTDYHVSVLKSLASYAAIALDNADAYRQLGTTVQQLGDTVENLMSTQARLVQSEKLASLGEMAAGIAHEIKNPLNFVNNFAELNTELMDELIDELAGREDVEPLLADLKRNSEQISQHGKRADSIVRAMMQHASGGTGERVTVDANALVEEYVGLAYHGMRATDRDFNLTLQKNLDPDVGSISAVPQEIGRVLLNLLGNAFYVVRERSMSTDREYVPTVTVDTRRIGDAVEIRVSDNGPGVPDAVQDRIFEPFFTTKPSGKGTGLGLSLSYEIVTAGHGGSMTVQSEAGAGATFVVSLPVNGV